MDKDSVSSMIRQLKRAAQFTDGDYVDFGLRNITAVPFSKENFHHIPEHLTEDCNPDAKIAFVDGGNAEIFASPAFCVHFIRIFHTIYSNNKRQSCSADEFYVVVSAEKSEKTGEDSFSYRARLLPGNTKTLTSAFFSTVFDFDPLDRALRTGNDMVSISRIPGIVRRIAELSTGLLLLNSLEKYDSVVLDGSLDSRTKDEEKVIAALRSLSVSKGVCVCGLSKTSSLLTRQGVPVSSALSDMTGLPVWYYHPVADLESAAGAPNHICFLKLHPKSDHVFRLDSFTDPGTGPVLPLLVKNSIDPVFLGYPYGLVEADRFARVSDHDADTLKAMLFARAGSEATLLRRFSQASDAHSILDNIL